MKIHSLVPKLSPLSSESLHGNEATGNEATEMPFFLFECWFVMLLIPYSGPARQCCYDEHGRLIIGPPAGGHSDVSSVHSQIIPPSVAMAIHLQRDITPFIQCCKSNESSCSSFYTFRPSAENECQPNPQPPSGMVLIMVWKKATFIAMSCLHLYLFLFYSPSPRLCCGDDQLPYFLDFFPPLN